MSDWNRINGDGLFYQIEYRVRPDGLEIRRPWGCGDIVYGLISAEFIRKEVGFDIHQPDADPDLFRIAIGAAWQLGKLKFEKR